MRISIAIAMFVVMMVPGISNAALTWVCSSGGDAVCYIENVELYVADSSTGDTYVMAKVFSTDGNLPCPYLRVKKGSQNATVDTIRAAEAAMLTAFTTGLPVKAKVQEETNGFCTVDKLIIAKP